MKKILVAVFALLLTACTGRVSVGEAAGTGVGALLGGYTASQFGGGNKQWVLVGVGALVGAMAGYNFGHELDPSDRALLSNTTKRALAQAEDGELVTWVNPVTGSAGTITPGQSYTGERGKLCRDYDASVAYGEKNGPSERQRLPQSEWKLGYRRFRLSPPAGPFEAV